MVPRSQLMTINNDEDDGADHMFAGSFDLETIWLFDLVRSYLSGERGAGGSQEGLLADCTEIICLPLPRLGSSGPLIKTNWTAGSGQTIRPAHPDITKENWEFENDSKEGKRRKQWGKQCLRAVKQVIKSEEEPLRAGGAAAQIIVMASVYLKA